MDPQADISAGWLINGKRKCYEDRSSSCQACRAKACSLKVWLQVRLSHRCTASHMWSRSWSCRAHAFKWHLVCWVSPEMHHPCVYAGTKTNGAASSRGRSTHKQDAGNGIREVSDEDSDEDLDLDKEGPRGKLFSGRSMCSLETLQRAGDHPIYAMDALRFHCTEGSRRHAHQTATCSQGTLLGRERPEGPLECNLCPTASTHGRSWRPSRTAMRLPACTAARSRSPACTTVTWTLPPPSLPTGGPRQVGNPGHAAPGDLAAALRVMV